jgi:hypothetical protein
MLQSFFLVNSLTFSLLPTLILARLPLSYPAVAYGLGLLVALLLFPVVLLSMLEETTCMMPYSAGVWRSLRRSWWAWFRFHLHSVGLLAVLALTAWTGMNTPNEWTMSLFVAVALVLLTIYFRLLGRLAYVIGRESDETPEDEMLAGVHGSTSPS